TAAGKKALAVAYKISDGSLAWQTPANNDKCAYVSPALIGDTLIVMTAQFVTGIDTKTGKALWTNDFKEASIPAKWGGINCNAPIVKGNKFFVTAGYDQGGVMYELLPNNSGVKVVWNTKDLDPHHHGVVEVDGKLYGSNWINNNNGNWVCLDFETGTKIYETPWDRLGKGVIIFADDMLYVYEEKRGTLGLVKPTDKFDVISKFPITYGSQQHWSHPVISDGVLYVRRGTALAAFDIKNNF
ncbi:MAG: PQQ-binding-like beta-propeller repeat protein, partial [Lentisphaeria bacterium]